MAACFSDYKINVCTFSDIVVDEAHNVLFSFPEDSLSPALKVTLNKTKREEHLKLFTEHIIVTRRIPKVRLFVSVINLKNVSVLWNFH